MPSATSACSAFCMRKAVPRPVACASRLRFSASTPCPCRLRLQAAPLVSAPVPREGGARQAGARSRSGDSAPLVTGPPAAKAGLLIACSESLHRVSAPTPSLCFESAREPSNGSCKCLVLRPRQMTLLDRRRRVSGQAGALFVRRAGSSAFLCCFQNLISVSSAE